MIGLILAYLLHSAGTVCVCFLPLGKYIICNVWVSRWQPRGHDIWLTLHHQQGWIYFRLIITNLGSGDKVRDKDKVKERRHGAVIESGRSLTNMQTETGR